MNPSRLTKHVRSPQRSKRKWLSRQKDLGQLNAAPDPGYKEASPLIGSMSKLACNFTTKAHGLVTWLTQLRNLVSLFRDFIEVRRAFVELFKMAKYYKEISHLLALGAESFEEELKKIVSNLFYNQFSFNVYCRIEFRLYLINFTAGYFYHTSHPFWGFVRH